MLSLSLEIPGTSPWRVFGAALHRHQVSVIQKVFCELLFYNGHVGAAEDTHILATNLFDKPFIC
jgi:hypothetical protein